MRADPAPAAPPDDRSSLYDHGFARVAVAVPRVHLADPVANTDTTLELARRASEAGAALVTFPELGLTGYSNDDLFHQDALLDAAVEALAAVVAGTADLAPLLVVGLPLRAWGRLFNVGAIVHGGRLLGLVPKSYLPNYREFYEKRQFSAARDAPGDEVTLLGGPVPFGTDLLVEVADVPGLAVHVEVCEDVWAPIPPSTYATMAGATVVANLSASPTTIGKDDYRRLLCSSHSASCIAAYLYSGASLGESTTDLAWDGHGLIYENGTSLAESQRFADADQLLLADVDLERLVQDRSRSTSWIDCATDHRDRVGRFRRLPVTLGVTAAGVGLDRVVERYPFVSSDPATLDHRCADAYRTQVQGLVTRLAATGIERIVLGVSGGLDSAHALLVGCQALDELGLPRSNLLGFTMPGPATGSTTKGNAHRLMAALGIAAAEIDITPSVRQMLHDIGHPAAVGEGPYDTTFENVQAGERTSHLFRLANHHGALVLGTGDLSELALGWCTYGVGDHMSHYNVNASVPKTLIQHLVRWVAAGDRLGPAASPVLEEIVATEISPELVPARGDDEATLQSTEDLIGPYDLHDFFLYYVARFGYRPSKIAYLAEVAWGDVGAGRWPASVPLEKRHAYDRATIEHWLEVFLRRFFGAQFKRSAVPNGPKIGSGGSLSPRGDWRMPSDAPPTAWLADLARAAAGA
jgi:NAD+ synthase (glutamine-hydrolysing)